jgi:hypothetical protein
MKSFKITSGEQKMKVKKLVTKLQKLEASAKKYYYSLKRPHFSDGFENKYGWKIRSILDELYSKELLEEFKLYVKENDLDYDINVRWEKQNICGKEFDVQIGERTYLGDIMA